MRFGSPIYFWLLLLLPLLSLFFLWAMVRKRRARRKAAGSRAPILVEARANARWSLDFVHDQFGCVTCP